MAKELLKEAVLQRLHNNKATWIRPKDQSHNNKLSNQAKIEINDEDPGKNTNKCINAK
jgi:hypothetical protein